MWTPNMTTPVVKMQCHRGPVNALGVDIEGNYMYTSGLDGKLKVWDIRKYQMVHEYFTPRPTTSIDVSDRGLVACGFGGAVQVRRTRLRSRMAGSTANMMVVVTNLDLEGPAR